MMCFAFMWLNEACSIPKRWIPQTHLSALQRQADLFSDLLRINLGQRARDSWLNIGLAIFCASYPDAVLSPGRCGVQRNSCIS